MQINLLNVEELIFRDKNAQRALPEFKHLYDQWSLSQQIPALKFVGRKVLIDFLLELNSEHILALESHFEQPITLDKFDDQCVKSDEIDCLELQDRLCEQEGFTDFCISRKDNLTYISFWR